MLLWYYTMNIQTLSHKEYYTERSRRNSDKKIICCFARSLISLHLISLFFLSFIPTSLFVLFLSFLFFFFPHRDSLDRSVLSRDAREESQGARGWINHQTISLSCENFFFFLPQLMEFTFFLLSLLFTHNRDTTPCNPHATCCSATVTIVGSSAAVCRCLMEMLKIDENNIVMKTIKKLRALIISRQNRVEFKLIRKEFHQKWEREK